MPIHLKIQKKVFLFTGGGLTERSVVHLVHFSTFYVLLDFYLAFLYKGGSCL